MKTALWDSYMEWLLGYVAVKGKKYSSYMKLYNHLHNTRFMSKASRDKNRSKDGENLRNEFFDSLGISGQFGKSATVLEVLVALACRVDSEFIGDPNNPHPEIIFWEMIENLGLDKFDDKNYDDLEVVIILEEWMLRKGDTTIFPIKKLKGVDKEEYLNMEIWKQMQYYINENYY